MRRPGTRFFVGKAPVSAAANWEAVRKRSAGVLARALASAREAAAGTAGRSAVTGRGSTVRCWLTRISFVAPVNGGCPASIS